MWSMTTIFHGMIHKEIEVCIDDVIIKFHESLDKLDLCSQTTARE